MEEKLGLLKTLLNEVDDLDKALAVLGWDQQTYMPSGGNEDRGNQMATLARIRHLKFTSDDIGRILDDLQPYIKQIDPDSNDARLVEVTRRKYDKATRVTSEWVAEFSRVTVTAEHIWEEARDKADFSIFQPHLEKVIEMVRQYTGFFAPFEHVYDPLLDEYEPGLKTVDVQSLFVSLLNEQVALIQAIGSRPQVDDSFLWQPFPENERMDFVNEIITRFGFDWHHGRLDKAIHPFTTSFGLGDVRITTRLKPAGIAMSLFSTMHECGHALYDQGYAPELNRTLLADGASMGIHESQSRMWEILVGHSRHFWNYFYPRMQKRFPAQLENISLEKFYKGINKVAPSLIRTEADEATYNLHIMLRLEIEIALLDGSLAVRDLPDYWNTKIQQYIGLVPSNDREGVLQDIHWSTGSFGYFPSYALGNLLSAQLWEKICVDIPNIERQFENGEFTDLLLWSRHNIHRHGLKFKTQELVQKVTGEQINTKPYMRYLRSKYGEIYGL